MFRKIKGEGYILTSLLNAYPVAQASSHACLIRKPPNTLPCIFLSCGIVNSREERTVEDGPTLRTRNKPMGERAQEATDTVARTSASHSRGVP